MGKTGRIIYRKKGGGLRDGLRVEKRRRVKGKNMGEVRDVSACSFPERWCMCSI